LTSQHNVTLISDKPMKTICRLETKQSAELHSVPRAPQNCCDTPLAGTLCSEHEDTLVVNHIFLLKSCCVHMTQSNNDSRNLWLKRRW